MLGITQKPAAAGISEAYNGFIEGMRSTAEAYFENKRYKVDENRPYILESNKDWRNNIILPEVVEWIESGGIKLHRWIHHGLSSQAMLLNLLGPLVVKNNYKAFKAVLNSKYISLKEGKLSAAFEYEDHKILKESKRQPTSIDFALKINEKPTLFIETKFREQEFGGCSKYDDCDCNKQNPLNNSGECFYNSNGMNYWPLLEKHNILDADFQDAKECPLLRYYQFYREVLFALEHDGYFVLIHDARNPYFINHYTQNNQGIFTMLNSRLPEKVRARVSAISVQELYSEIKASGDKAYWIGQFGEKYGM